MIVTRALTKRYGRVLAVDRVDLDVREGDRYGFLGPNGSGKTTVVRMLLGLVYATSGEIEVMGRPVPSRVTEVLPQVGALVEGPSCYGHLSGRANLALIDAAGRAGPRRTRGRRIAGALDRVGLAGVDNRAVKKYSLGMRQRLGLAAALLRSPRLLVLDEPTNGLDPQGIREIRDLLAAPRSSCPATSCPRSSSCAPGSASWTAAGSSCSRTWTSCGRPPAGSCCAPRTPTARRRCWTAGSRSATATAWWSPGPTRPRSTPAWSARGCGCWKSGPSAAHSSS